MDDETRQYFQALSAQISDLKDSQDRRFEEQDRKIEALDRKFEAFRESVNQKIEALNARIDSLSTLLGNVKEALEREIGMVGGTVERMEAWINKITAGAHFVSKLWDWSEKQDVFQADILKRVQSLESPIDKLGA
jgi:chromosome segregation ATPase